MGILKRLIQFFGGGLCIGTLAYFSLSFAWRVITTVLGEMTLLWLLLGILAIPVGLVLGFIACFYLMCAIFGD